MPERIAHAGHALAAELHEREDDRRARVARAPERRPRVVDGELEYDRRAA